MVQKIDLALSKIEDGSYGTCTGCGEDIGQKRLEARPVAALCIDCKSQQEKLEGRF
jgi:DnaK suppressor protein